MTCNSLFRFSADSGIMRTQNDSPCCIKVKLHACWLAYLHTCPQPSHTYRAAVCEPLCREARGPSHMSLSNTTSCSVCNTPFPQCRGKARHGHSMGRRTPCSRSRHPHSSHIDPRGTQQPAFDLAQAQESLQGGQLWWDPVVHKLAC